MAGPRRVKHTPQRTCIACRSVSGKRQLTRLVRTAEGRVMVDPGGKAHGRGAYLCQRRACWHAALGGGLLERALNVTVNEADRAALAAHSEQYADVDA